MLAQMMRTAMRSTVSTKERTVDRKALAERAMLLQRVVVRCQTLQQMRTCATSKISSC